MDRGHHLHNHIRQGALQQQLLLLLLLLLLYLLLEQGEGAVKLLLLYLLLLHLLLEAEAVDGVGDGGLLPQVVVGEEVAAGLGNVGCAWFHSFRSDQYLDWIGEKG